MIPIITNLKGQNPYSFVQKDIKKVSKKLIDLYCKSKTTFFSIKFGDASSFSLKKEK